MKMPVHIIRAVVASIAFLSLPACNKTPVIYAQRQDIIETVYASGRLISENEFKLSAQINGTILKKLVKDGDAVQKDQLLYIVNNEAARERFEAAQKNYQNLAANLSDQSPLLNDLKLALLSAETKCRNDSTNYERYKNLWMQQIGTKSNLDNVYTNYLVSQNLKKSAEQKYHSTLNDLQVSYSHARSQLTEARKDLKEYFIRSDQDGVVYQTFKEAGETVYMNEVVALVGHHRERVIRLAVDQQDIDKIRKGQQVLLQSDVTGSTIHEGVVTAVYPVMNEQDQTFRVDARFTRPPAQAFVHSSIEANIIVQKKSRALVLPRNALLDHDSVLIDSKGKEKKAAVKTGIATLDYVEIVSGLDEKTPVYLPEQKEEP